MQTRGRRILLRSANAALLGLLVANLPGCQQAATDPAEGDAVASTAQALGVGEYEVTMTLPAFATAGDVVLAANGQVDLGDRVTILRDATNPSVLANTGTAGTVVGSSAKTASVFSQSLITVRDSGTIDGDVLTTVTPNLVGGAKITGAVNPNAVFAPEKTVTWQIQYPATSQGDVTVNQTRTLAPGRFSNVTVNSGGTLTLSSGTYYLDSLTLNSAGALRLNQSEGPVLVYVRNSIAYRGRVTAVGGGIPQWLVVYLGTANALLESPFIGTWISPNGRLVLGASGTTHQGSFYTKNLQVYPDVKIKQLRMSGDFDGDGLSTADEIDLYGSNPFVADSDSDGLADGAEVQYWDARTDGIKWNSDVDILGARSQRSSGDGLINLLDPDSDNDGLLDGAELSGWNMPTPSGATAHVDSDPALHDTDRDGLIDNAERLGWDQLRRGVTQHVYANPRSADTDGDTLSDLVEIDQVRSDPQNTHTFGQHYSDQARLENISAAGPSVLDPPCTLYADGDPENVYVTYYSVQHQVAAPIDSRTVRQLYVEDSRKGQPFTVSFRSEVSSDPNTVDPKDTFTDIKVKRPNATTFETLSPGPHPGEYSVVITPTAGDNGGFYDLQATYHLDTDLSKYRFSAKFNSDNAYVPLAWTDPDLSAHVELGFVTDGANPVYLRGGAYGDGTETAQSSITNIYLGSQKLYERAFNGADFNFPLGALANGSYDLSFDWQVVGSARSKLMTHICQHGVNWNDVQITYLAGTHTRDYGAWKTGVAAESAVIRRDTLFKVVGHDARLAAGDGSIEIYRGGTLQSGWVMSRRENYDARDGHFQHWEVTVPSNAAIGNYTLRMLTNLRAQVGSDVPFKLIFNPYRSVDANFTKDHLETFAYDEDEDGDAWGADDDQRRDDWTVLYRSKTTFYTYRLHSFVKRNNGAEGLLDLALAATEGATDEFDAATRLFRLMNQRIIWTSPWFRPDVDDMFGPIGGAAGSEFTLADARTYSRNNQDLYAAAPQKRMEGQCLDFAAGFIGLARAIGIPARHTTVPSAFDWGYHTWPEIYLPSSLLPKQDGQTTAGGGTTSDRDNWYVFDATDNFSPVGGWAHSEEAIDPRVDYYASFIQNGASVPTAIYTAALDWCLPGDTTCDNVTHNPTNVLSDYAATNDYYIVGSSASGWLSAGDKDLFKVNLTSSKTVSIAASTDLDIVFCAYDYTPSSAKWFDKCASPTNSTVLGSGLWTIQVFSQSQLDGVHGGNYVRYTVNVN